MMCLKCGGTGKVKDWNTCSDAVSSVWEYAPCPDCHETGRVPDEWFKRYLRERIVCECAECGHHTYVAISDDDKALCPACWADTVTETATTVATTTV